jgi:hypothetical protein
MVPAPSLRQALINRFGIDFPISGGRGDSIESPIVIHLQEPNDYVGVEYGVLKCLGIGRNVEWRLLKNSLCEHNGNTIEQMKIETTELTDTQVITQIENYYFDITLCFGRNGPSQPQGFFGITASERVAALRATSAPYRDVLLSGVRWPRMSPGGLNAWLVFIGPSPGASPGHAAWDYDPRPSIGGPHPGLSEYEDANGFWAGIRAFARAVFPDVAVGDAYALTMVRNLDEELAAVGPKGSHMVKAAANVVGDLGRIVKPRLVVAIGGARKYCDDAFRDIAHTIPHRSGLLFTALKRHQRSWSSRVGVWPGGQKYLYVSPSGIHPSLPHVSQPDAIEFLTMQAEQARIL